MAGLDFVVGLVFWMGFLQLQDPVQEGKNAPSGGFRLLAQGHACFEGLHVCEQFCMSHLL